MFVIRFVWRLCRPYGLSVALLAACMAVETVYVSLSPLSFKYLIDEAFPNKDADLFLLVLASLVLGGALNLGAGVLSDYQLAKVTERAVTNLRQRMFGTIVEQPPAFYRQFGQGSLANRLTADVSSVDRIISGALPRAFREMLALLIGGSLLFQLEWKLSLVMAMGVIVLFASPYLLQGKAERSSARYRDENDAYLSVVDEVLKGHRVIKGMNAAPYILGRVRQRLASLLSAGFRLTFVYAILDRIPQTAFLLLNAVMIGYGGYLIFQDSLTVGAFIAFYTIFLNVGQSVTSLSQIIPSLIEAGVSFSRIDELLRYRSPLKGSGTSKPFPEQWNFIRFRDVAFGYDERSLALTGVNLSLPHGSMTAFVGQSGSGKSTALQLLLRFYDPSRGAIEVDGLDLSEVSEAQYRAQTGIVLQDTFLFNTTIYENIALARPDVTEAMVRAAARKASIDEFIARLPDGYQTMVKDFGGNLSGGQRQRIAIARALIGNPQLLVLDEITSALDPSTEAEIARLVYSLQGERTIVTVTHRLASVVNADRIVVFKNGGVIESGTHLELLHNGGYYAAMWEKQHGFELSEDGFLAKVESRRLSQLPFFRDIPFEQLSILAELFVTEKYDVGHAVVRENEAGDKFYIIVRGRVSIVKGGTVVAMLEDGDHFGEIALLKDIPRTADVMTAVPTVLLSLRREQLLELSAAYPAIRDSLEQTLEERMKG